jgi:hypothetical protein
MCIKKYDHNSYGFQAKKEKKEYTLFYELLTHNLQIPWNKLFYKAIKHNFQILCLQQLNTNYEICN